MEKGDNAGSEAGRWVLLRHSHLDAECLLIYTHRAEGEVHCTMENMGGCKNNEIPKGPSFPHSPTYVDPASQSRQKPKLLSHGYSSRLTYRHSVPRCYLIFTPFNR